MENYFNWKNFKLDSLDKITEERARIQMLQMKARENGQFDFANELQNDIEYLGGLQNTLIENLKNL